MGNQSIKDVTRGTSINKRMSLNTENSWSQGKAHRVSIWSVHTKVMGDCGVAVDTEDRQRKELWDLIKPHHMGRKDW